jgi:hypothetical protein
MRSDGGAGPMDSPLDDVSIDGGAGDQPSGEDTGSTPPGRDCFPDCVASLRRSCQRPATDMGSCVHAGTETDGVICYSNGVREVRMQIADGGVAVEFTQPDGQTVCYRVVVSGAVLSFRTPAGQEVARVTDLGGNLYDVTCNSTGMTTMVDNSPPSCRTLNRGDCTSGSCP